MDKSKIITLMSFDTSGEAEIVRSLLESAGVESELLNEVMSAMLPLQSDFFSIRLVINEDDEERAKEILAAKFDTEEFDIEEFDIESKAKHKRE